MTAAEQSERNMPHQQRAVASAMHQVHFARGRVAVDPVFARRVEVKLQELVVLALVVHDGGSGRVNLHGVAVEADAVVVQAHVGHSFCCESREDVLGYDGAPVQRRTRLEHGFLRVEIHWHLSNTSQINRNCNKVNKQKDKRSEMRAS